MTTLTAENLIIDIPERPDGTPLSIQVQAGNIWGVLGPNGAGKTTLLHTLAGLRKPRGGSVLIDNTDLSTLRRKQIAQKLAVVFQERMDGFPSTVLETALVGRHPFLSAWDIETNEDLDLAREALAALDLADLEDRMVNTLSGGERQRLAFATALTQTPKLWLADEPSNHLDLHHQVKCMELLASEAAQGRAVFMCLHDINLAARWCSHILLLYRDGTACWGEKEDMLNTAALETLYSQKLTCAQIDGTRFFLPVGSHDQAARE